jgi:S-DNA-T family DNA segregation ATPase FtsK/SpoIIIE
MRETLKFQSERIETVLSLHKIPARVTGGTVAPRWVRFQVLPQIGAKISGITGLDEELAAALNAPDCRVSRRGAAVDIEVPRDDPLPVRLLPLYRRLDEGKGSIPPTTAVLGLAEDGTPLMIRLSSPDVGHILVVGAADAGKTVLMQSMILSLSLANSAPSPFQAEEPTGGLRLILIAPKGADCTSPYAFDVFQGLPHLARNVIRETGEATESLHSLVRLMEKHSDGNGNRLALNGRIVVVIDELVDLLVAEDDIQRLLVRLTQRGREAGIHVIAATQNPSAEVLGSLINRTGTVRADFPVRLVGRVACVDDARAATGWSGTGAERLTGRGDFLAVAEGRATRFQAAHASPQEIREVVAYLARHETVTPAVSESWTRPLVRLAEVFREES